MPKIANDEALRAAVRRAGAELQAIQDYVGSVEKPAANVRFPRGFLRTAASVRATLPTLGSDALVRNICYSLIMSDVLRWIAIRTDLAGIAKEMVVKEGICLLGNVCESLTKHLLKGKGSSQSFKQRSAKLEAMGAIGPTLRQELDCLWDTRNNEHLYKVPYPEYHRYSPEDYNRALATYKELCKALRARFG